MSHNVMSMRRLASEIILARKVLPHCQMWVSKVQRENHIDGVIRPE